MNVEVKPCPHCGAEISTEYGQLEVTRHILFFLCERCGAVTSFRASPDPVAAWNRRHDTLEIARLRAALADRETKLRDYIGPDWDIDASPQTLADIRREEQRAVTEAQAALSAAQAEAEAYKADAENWGPALNEAGWRFSEVYREVIGEPESVKLFNHCKTILRAAMRTYFQHLDTARTSTTGVNAP